MSMPISCAGALFVRAACFCVLAIAVGCGHYPPPVYSAGDVRRVPTSEKSIHARGLQDDDIPSLERLRELTYISFGSGVSATKSKITDKGLEKLAKLNLPHLETLDLGWCNNITDAGMADVRRMRTIKRLLLYGCPMITDAAMTELAEADNLAYLDLRGCPGVSDRGLEALGTKAHWEWIVLDGAPNITPRGVAQLRAALPNTRIDKDDDEWEQRIATVKIK